MSAPEEEDVEPKIVFTSEPIVIKPGILLYGQDTGVLLYGQDTGILVYRQDTGILVYCYTVNGQQKSSLLLLLANRYHVTKHTEGLNTECCLCKWANKIRAGSVLEIVLPCVREH